MTGAGSPGGGAAPADQPVFLLCAGGRTGSTHLQRLVISSGEALVWGEHDGLYMAALEPLLAGLHRLSTGSARTQYAHFAAQGPRAWLANVQPPFEHVLEGARALWLEALGRPARDLGYPRWGFKEIRYGGDSALALRTLFPGGRFVVLVRNPRAALRSIKSVPWYLRDHQGDPRSFLRQWERLGSSLLEVLPRLGPGLLLRHEALRQDPEGALATLGGHLGIDPARFDRGVLTQVLRGKALPPAALDAADLAALGEPDILALAERLGYPPAEILG